MHNNDDDDVVVVAVVVVVCCCCCCCCCFFFAGNDKEGAGTEPEPEIIMGPIHIFKLVVIMFSSLVLLLSPLKRSSTFSLSFSFSFSSLSPFLLLLLLLPLGPFPRCTLSCCDYFKKFSTLATPLPHHTLECFQKEEKGEKEGEVVYLGFSCSSSSVWCLSFLCF